MQGNQTEKIYLALWPVIQRGQTEGTSLSIQHQEEMLRDYAAKQGFAIPFFSV